MVSHRPEHGLVSAVWGNTVCKLQADGEKFKIKETVFVAAGEFTHSCTRDPVQVFNDGSWLLPVYMGAPQRTDSAFLLRSYDEGKTWPDATIIAQDPAGAASELHGLNFNETCIADLGSGELLAMIRADETFHSDGAYIPVGGVGQLYMAKSFNWGMSWSRPAETGLFGQPANVCVALNGTLVASFGHRRKPYGVKVATSTDRGYSWKELGYIKDGGDSWDIGYPCTVEVTPDEFLTVYYDQAKDGTRHIACTTWRLTE
jgi:hypothetical protein